MNTSTFLTKTSLISIRILVGFMLLIQVSSCDLEVIPPTTLQSNLMPKSIFSFVVEDPTCTSNCKVLFTNTSQNATSYEWSFGDESTTSTLKDPVHTYASSGTYDVKLKAMRDTVTHDTTMVIAINSSGSTTPFQAFMHIATTSNINSQITDLDNPLTNGVPTKIVVVAPVLGVRNQAALGVFYYNNKWAIFNEDISIIKPDEKFNVVVADPTNSKAFVHITSTANLRTGYISTLDHPSVNNRPNARVFVTPLWEKYTDYNTHPVGVVYTNNRWEIINLDQANLPVDLKFNVIVSEDNKASFVHTATATSIVSDYTKIDDVKTNNKPDLKIIAITTQGTSATPIINPNQIGLWYSGGTAGRWTIFNEVSNIMAQNSKFNILIVE